MLNALIVDDEADGRDVLQLLLADFCPDVTVVGTCASGREAVQALSRQAPDVVFLDIDMPDLSGFDVLDCVRGAPLRVVFVTAHHEHALRAFRYCAVDYLLKPVAPQALMEAVSRVRAQLAVPAELVGSAPTRALSAPMPPAGQYELLARQLRQRETLPDVMALPMADGLQVVRISGVLYCRADRNYTHLQLSGGEKLLVSRPLKEFEQLLLPHGFFRVHHSALINLSCISRYVRGDGGYVEMLDGTCIEVARQRKEDFLRLLPKLA